VAQFTGPLRNPPVVYVVCQIRFAPVPRPESVSDRVHEAMHDEGFARQDVQMRGLKITPNAPPEFLENERRTRFDNREGTIGYILAPDQLIAHRTHYTSFDDFLANIMFGFRALLMATKPPFIQRIGLRYVDLITPTAEETVADYVVDRLLGFEPALTGVTRQTAQQFAQLVTAEGRMFVRASRGKHSEPLPADLLPMTLKPERSPDPQRESFILDIDHFAENLRLDPEPAEIERRIRELQAPMADIFRSAITDHAVRMFEPLKRAS